MEKVVVYTYFPTFSVFLPHPSFDWWLAKHRVRHTIKYKTQDNVVWLPAGGFPY